MIRWTGLAPWEFEFPFPGGDVWRGAMALAKYLEEDSPGNDRCLANWATAVLPKRGAIHTLDQPVFTLLSPGTFVSKRVIELGGGTGLLGLSLALAGAHEVHLLLLYSRYRS